MDEVRDESGLDSRHITSIVPLNSRQDDYLEPHEMKIDRALALLSLLNIPEKKKDKPELGIVERMALNRVHSGDAFLPSSTTSQENQLVLFKQPSLEPKELSGFQRDLKKNGISRSKLSELYPYQFIRHWRDNCLKERAVAFLHPHPDFIMRIIVNEGIANPECPPLYGKIGIVPIEYRAAGVSTPKQKVLIDNGERTVIIARSEFAAKHVLAKANERVRRLIIEAEGRSLFMLRNDETEVRAIDKVRRLLQESKIKGCSPCQNSKEQHNPEYELDFNNIPEDPVEVRRLALETGEETVTLEDMKEINDPLPRNMKHEEAPSVEKKAVEKFGWASLFNSKFGDILVRSPCNNRKNSESFKGTDEKQDEEVITSIGTTLKNSEKEEESQEKVGQDSGEQQECEWRSSLKTIEASSAAVFSAAFGECMESIEVTTSESKSGNEEEISKVTKVASQKRDFNVIIATSIFKESNLTSDINESEEDAKSTRDHQPNQIEQQSEKKVTTDNKSAKGKETVSIENEINTREDTRSKETVDRNDGDDVRDDVHTRDISVPNEIGIGTIVVRAEESKFKYYDMEKKQWISEKETASSVMKPEKKLNSGVHHTLFGQCTGEGVLTAVVNE